MRIQPVTGPAFRTKCICCDKSLTAGTQGLDSFGRLLTDKVFADLDGEPFKAYYCEDCVITVWS
jgi:hypothetical protein